MILLLSGCAQPLVLDMHDGPAYYSPEGVTAVPCWTQPDGCPVRVDADALPEPGCDDCGRSTGIEIRPTLPLDVMRQALPPELRR